MSESDTVLKSFIERYLRLQDEEGSVKSDIKELMIEIKSSGLTPSNVKAGVRMARSKADNLEKYEASEFEKNIAMKICEEIV